ncbi:endonuclease/exonuclease/phosphatase family protein [bacterium]|nr:endonuclease/exonuclease/phosphatase family protein [bacterium]
MKIKPMAFTLTALLLAGSSISYGANKKEEVLKVDVMSFNIRNANGDKSTSNDWDNRKEQLCDIIRRYTPDVIGLQEAFRSQIDDIRKNLPEYGEIGSGRDGGKKGEYSAILYRLKRFKVEKSDTFWLSDTPEKPSKSQKWGNACIRICTWARLIEKKSGHAFYMFNTHLDHLSQLSREKSVQLIMTHIQKRKYPDPFVLTGDFNMGKGNPAIKYLEGTENIKKRSPITLVDTFRVLYPDEKNVGTFNSFKGLTNGKKIDYIFVEPNTRILAASIIRTQKEGRYPSDHYPITATICFVMTNSTQAVKKETNRFSLWQLPSERDTIILSYVIKTDKGKLIVIDGGWLEDGEYLKNFLKAHGGNVHSWFLTHCHDDHIGALSWILTNKTDIVIENIYASFPPLDWIKTNSPGTVSTVEIFQAALTNAGRTTIQPHAGDEFGIDDVHIEILNDYDLSITRNCINNSSILVKVSDPTKSVLFLGDFGKIGGTNLLTKIDRNKLKADYVQMAHHGQTGVDEDFYKIIGPKYCLWPTPSWLWDNDIGRGFNSGIWQTVKTRKWMKNLNVRSNYVASFTSSPQLIFAAKNFATELLTKKEIDPTSPLDSYVSIGKWNSNGNNPQLSLNPRDADKFVYLSSGSVVEVKCRFDAGTSNTFLQWFINDGSWQVKFKNIKKINDGKFHVYRATLLMDLGEMKSFTLNPFDKNSMGESFAIDYIRIKSPLMINPIDAANSKFIYTSLAEWNTNGCFENWTVNNAANITVSNGLLSAKSSGNGDIQIVKSVTNGLPEMNLDLDSNKIIEFRLKRSNTSKNLEIYCGTKINPVLSSATRIKILANPMPQKNKFYIYRLDMSKYKKWKGTLETLRFDPVTTSGITIDIDYIRIGQIIANK